MKPSASTSEIIGQDIEFIEENMADDPTGFWARTMIKTVVSFMEAETHILKLELLEDCENSNVKLPPAFILFLQNKRYEVTGSGSLKSRNLQNRLQDDIKFLFKNICKLQGFSQEVDYSSENWNKLIRTIEVRNRLTHPKTTDSLSVTKAELHDASMGLKWFTDNCVGFSQQIAGKLQENINRMKKTLDDSKQTIRVTY